jgi:hypothetical protein
MWGDVDEVNTIAYLRMLGSDHSIAANHIIFYGQTHTELRSFLHGKEALHVATAETYLLVTVRIGAPPAHVSSTSI